MTLQDKIQKKAKGYGKLAPAFLEGAEFALNNQWISVDEDLPCNNEEMIDNSVFPHIETIAVITYDENNEIGDNFMYKKGDIWKWKKYPKPKYWCLYPEPPK